jgi:GT2 family glycosyltransferase/glycosyltransferase involved in cell wall biosynthesis
MKASRRVDILNYNFFDWSGERLYTGGAERYVIDLAMLLRRKRLTVRLLQTSKVPFNRQYKNFEVVGVAGPEKADFKAMSATYASLTEDAVMVIASPIELACHLPPSVTSIGINHGIWWDDPHTSGGESNLADRQSLLDALRVVRHCVCVDTNFINWLRTVDGTLLDRLSYVPNYVALDRFVPTKKSFEGPLQVLFPRRLCTERGFDQVLTAFDRMLPQHPEMSLHICGGGRLSQEQRAREFVARHSKQATWSEVPMEDMPSVFAHSHVVVLPTNSAEGTSLACIEAMATRNGVIASHVGGLGNLVIDDFNGLLIAPGEGALKSAVERLFGDRKLLKRLAVNAVAVSSAFSHRRWEQHWLSVISQSLGGSDRFASGKGPSARARHNRDGNPARIERNKPRLQATLSDALAARDAASELATTLALERADAVAAHEEAMRELDEAVRRGAKAHAEAQEVTRGALAESATMTAEATRLRDANEALLAARTDLQLAFEALSTELVATSRDRDSVADQLRRATMEAEDLRALLTAEGSRLQQANDALLVAHASLRDQGTLIAELTSERDAAEAQSALVTDRLRRVDADFGSLQRTAQELDARTAFLESALAARDEGIAWLRGELRVAQQDFVRRRASFRFLLIDGTQAFFDRLPALKHIARTIVPKRIRRIVTDRSFRQERSILSETLTQAAGEAISLQRIPGTSGQQEGYRAFRDRWVPKVDAKFDIICFANIDWTARYQRPQHTMRAFADDGHRVYYIIGSRLPPDGSRYFLEQVANNVFQVCLGVDHLEDLYGKSMSATTQTAMATAINALVTDQHIRLALSIVHLPYWASLALQLKDEHAWRVVYDCMDEWEGFPHIGQELLDAERSLVERADLVTVTGSLLEAKWKGQAKRCVVVRNAVDFAYFSQRCVPNRLLESHPHPILGYYGALAEWVDFALLADVARQRPDWNLVLVGDQFVPNLEGLEALPNVYLVGRQPYETMPHYLYHFDVCLIPFKLDTVTHAVDPVKFYEYISVGKPVVAVPLKEMQIYSAFAYFAEGAKGFIARIEEALGESDPNLRSERIAFARANDWQDRHKTMLRAIDMLYPLVSIVLVTYGNVELTKLCIESVFRNTQHPRVEIIIVDNASTDGTRVYLDYLAHAQKNVKVILNNSNRGFAAANNQAFAYTSGEVIILLNNDTVVPAGWLEPLLRHLGNDEIGLVGPVSNFVGNEARIEVDYTTIDGMDTFATRYMSAQERNCFDVEVVAMFCLAMRREVLERVGLLDEAFGIGMFEDDDYSKRVRAAGWRTVCATDSFVHHFGQASFKKLIPTGEYQEIWNRNQAYFERKWGKWSPHVTRTAKENHRASTMTPIVHRGEG